MVSMPLAAIGARYARGMTDYVTHIAAASRQAGMAAVLEQNMALAPDTPGDVRSIHRADVRIIENDGRQLWVGC